AALFRHPTISSQLGFNSVASVGEMIWASHSDGGVVGWDGGAGDEPRIVRQFAGARNLIALDDRRAIFSSMGGVFAIDAEGETTALPAAGNIVLIALDQQCILLVREDGQLDRIDRASLARIDSRRCCGGVTAACTLPWLGTMRLLLASGDGPVYCVGTDDALVTQYASA